MTRDQIIDAVQRRHLTPADREIAAAIVDMLGPEPLEWDGSDAYSHCDLYEVLRGSGGYSLYSVATILCLDTFPTLEAAKAAAQAHHEAEHWKRTRIWEDE